jgi:hypothetical protein
MVLNIFKIYFYLSLDNTLINFNLKNYTMKNLMLVSMVFAVFSFSACEQNKNVPKN